MDHEQATTPQSDAQMAEVPGNEPHMTMDAALLSVLEHMKFYDEFLSPLMKVRFRMYDRVFKQACGGVSSETYQHNMLERFRICELVDRHVYSNPAQSEEEQFEQDKQAWAMKCEELHKAFGDKSDSSEATIRIYQLAAFAMGFCSWYQHTKPAHHDLKHMAKTDAYNGLFDELMQHAGIQDALERNMSLHGKALNDEAHRFAQVMIEDFINMIEVDNIAAKCERVIKRHQARFTKMAQETAPYIQKMSSTLPFSFWDSYLQQELQKAGVPEAKLNNVIDHLVHDGVHALEKMDVAEVPLGSSQMLRFMQDCGADKYFGADDTSVQFALLMCTAMRSHMLEYLYCAGAHQLDSSENRHQWKQVNDQRRSMMKKLVNTALDNLTETVPLPKDYAHVLVEQWCDDVDDAVAKHASRSSAKGRG